MGFAKWSTILLAVGEVSAFQVPLFSQKTPYTVSGELVSSTSLQDRIDIDALFGRAEKLYRIAESSVDEYGHPTRVIGSEGKLICFFWYMALYSNMFNRSPENN